MSFEFILDFFKIPALVGTLIVMTVVSFLNRIMKIVYKWWIVLQFDLKMVEIVLVKRVVVIFGVDGTVAWFGIGVSVHDVAEVRIDAMMYILPVHILCIVYITLSITIA